MSRWYALSTHFLTDEKVEVLGEQHGPAGPLVIVALLCRAKTQAKGGKVDGTFRDLAHLAYCDRKEIRDILASAIKCGLVEGELNGKGYRLGFPKWNNWQSASRMAMKRERDRRKSLENVTGSDEALREVTNKTIQDNTNNPKRLKIEQVFNAWVTATGRNLSRVTLTRARSDLIARRLDEYPVEDLVDACKGLGASAFHRGDNDRGKRYDTLELCLRDASKIEGFRDEHRGDAAPPPPVNKFLDD